MEQTAFIGPAEPAGVSDFEEQMQNSNLKQISRANHESGSRTGGANEPTNGTHKSPGVGRFIPCSIRNGAYKEIEEAQQGFQETEET